MLFRSREGRYFTVTGQCLGVKYSQLSDTVQNLDWLIERVWGESMVPHISSDSADESDLLYHRAPLADWDADRIRQEIAPYLDLEMHYEDWIKWPM